MSAVVEYGKKSWKERAGGQTEDEETVRLAKANGGCESGQDVRITQDILSQIRWSCRTRWERA